MFELSDKQYKILDRIIRCVYPKCCPVCGKIIPIREDYCACSRYESVKLSENFCKHCGYNYDKCICSGKNTIVLPEFTAVYLYGGKIRSDILNLKFNNEKRLAKSLGRDMAERCALVFYETDFDMISFMPMSTESYYARTYNQSQLLADEVGKRLFVPVKPLFNKIRKTENQHKLSGKERLKNLEGSVELIDSSLVKGKNILLCDDVKTTGSTLKQCVDLLEEAGANKVSCICVALVDFRI